MKVVLFCLALLLSTFGANAGTNTIFGMFGKVPISFHNITSYRPDWEAVLPSITSFCTVECEPRVQKLLSKLETQDIVIKLRVVNEFANKIQYRSKAFDNWSTPEETLELGEGDCEDFAILKMAMLHRIGIAFEDMALVILKDKSREDRGHAVLAVRKQPGSILILDVPGIKGNKVEPDSEFPHYFPLFAFSGNYSSLLGIEREEHKN